MENTLLELRALEKRIIHLEQRGASSRGPSRVVMGISEKMPAAATDDFATRMMTRALAMGFTNTRFVRCPDDYYERSLAYRRNLLNAPSEHHLAKSIILHNTRHADNGTDGQASDVHGDENDMPHDPQLHASRYVCVILGYTSKLDTELLRTVVRRSAPGEKLPPISAYNFRLAGDASELTGFVQNAVTPLGMLFKMPIVLDEAVSKLEPRRFWLGGGDVNLKWNVDTTEFMHAFRPAVARVAVPS